MGWRGTVRSLAAAARAAERDAQRRHKAAMKAQMIDDAADAVDSWDSYIDDLLTVHVNLADEISWQEIADLPKPVAAVPTNTHAQTAKGKLESYRPGPFAFLKGGKDKVISKLEAAMEEAITQDEEAYKAAIVETEAALEDWEAETSLARRLLKGEPEALKEVIEEFQSLNSNGLIGSAINFTMSEGIVHARPQVHTDEIIPSFRRKQLASGRLSETKMPVGQFNELYQDYVASVALKVAGDLFRILPQTTVYVTCESEMLDTTTGHKKPTPVLSVQFVQETFLQLNLESIDPSDSMANFNHRMKFTKTKGFTPVEALSYGD